MGVPAMVNSGWSVLPPSPADPVIINCELTAALYAPRLRANTMKFTQ